MLRKKTPEELLEEIQDFYYLAGINHAINVINGQERYKGGWNESKDRVWLALQSRIEKEKSKK